MISLTTGLRELGYVEGQTLAIEHRFAGGRIERLPELAGELVQLKMDVIVAVAPNAIRAARDAATTIPIVMYGGVDPIAAGVVASLARPGGNLTGVLIAPGYTLVGKKLELLREVVPRAVRVGFLSPDNSGAQGQVPEAQKAAAFLTSNWSWRRLRTAITTAPSTLWWPSGLPLFSSPTVPRSCGTESGSSISSP